ncbi:MAG: hypothetical protein KGJ44_01630 [Betaproteobacteria bacterium]|nr:hypothetical protein [Betaproteobacteria bacterium]MDE2047083.1 hypothetical protein [Betaproteobacteria bacterium]
MKKELDALLCRRYPLIFAERDLPMTRTSMCWGFACGDGWFDLVDALCERLQFWTDHNQAPQVVAVQVKEKWGELRFYPRPPVSEEQWGMIWMAQAMSGRICEVCGKPGQIRVHEHWHLTRCAEHAPTGAVAKEDDPTAGIA